MRTSETWLGLRVTADFARTALCPSLRKALTAVGADLGFVSAARCCQDVIDFHVPIVVTLAACVDCNLY